MFSAPPPGLYSQLWGALFLVCLYLAFRPLSPVLSEFGLDAFVLAFVLSIAATTWLNLPAAVEHSRRALYHSGAATKAVLCVTCALAFLLLIAEPIWCQRILTLAPVGKALLLCS